MFSVRIRLALTKGSGDWPDLSILPAEKRFTAYLHQCMTLQLDDEDVTTNFPVIGYRIIDSGLCPSEFGQGISVVDGEIVGHPTPVIQFTLDGERQNFDDEGFLHAVWQSSYKMEIPELHSEEPFYWEDHNGYSSFVDD